MGEGCHAEVEIYASSTKINSEDNLLSLFMKKPSPTLFQHPLMGADVVNLFRALSSYGGFPFSTWGHFAFFLGSALVRKPFAIMERAIYRKRLQKGEQQDPVIVVGYWRSGTTHLHNLLANNPRFGIITPIASGLPGEILTLGSWLESSLVKALPEDRGVDKVAVTPQSPQEDEIPVANLQSLSVFHALYFARNFRKNFDRGVFFDGVAKTDVDRWKKQLLYFLGKIALHQKKPQILLKNPVYTARIALLREIWPKAKFIHIYRNPYKVFQSTHHYFKKMLDELALQSYDLAAIEPLVLESYPRMLNQLYADAKLLPEKQFAEVKFEHLEKNPLQELERIYTTLDLPNWKQARPLTENYLAQISGYTKNQYAIDPAVVNKVQQHWRPFLKRWDYGDQTNVE